MTPPNFISTYFPELSDISADTLRDTRDRVTTYMQSNYPDLIMTPNSVFGDLVITPFAHLLAAHEEAMGRFMSDLDLENVANGVIFNCEFVRKYLGNFAVVDRTNLKSTGVIRIVFCSDQAYTIDRRTRYSFGDESHVFYLKLPHPGHLLVLAAGSSLTPYTNSRVLVPIDIGKWAIDIGVVGTMDGDPVLQGDSGASDVVNDDIDSIYASIDFTKGLPESSLSVLAEKTRATFYSATLNTRAGARHFLGKEFPSIISSSPVINGDTEQVREVVAVLGAPSGKVDIFVQSNGFATQDSQTITLKLLNPVPSEGNPSRFVGKIEFLNPPCYIDSIVSASQPTIDLHFRDLGEEQTAKILSRSSDFDKAPLLQAAYSKYEDYYLSIDMPLDGEDPLLTTIVSGGDQYHHFTITYRSDPMVPVIADTVDSKDVAPIGIDVLTKGYVVIVINTLTISYVKTPGVTMALDTARTEIYNYFRSLAYTKVYTDSKIVDSMYYAGASEIVSIVPDAEVQWSVADAILPESYTDDPVDDWNAADTASMVPTPLVITTTAGLTPAYIDPNIGEVTATYAAVGKRNICYLLDAANIVFTEVIA